MENEQQDRIFKLLSKLNHSEEFCLWRDEVAKPLVDQLEADLEANSDTMSETILRSKLKHYFTVKNLTKKWFEQVEAQIELEKES